MHETKSFKRPVGASIVAVLSVITGVLTAGMYLGLAFYGHSGDRFVMPVIEWPGLINTLNAIVGISGIFYIIAGVGLWKMKRWAWWMAIVVAIIEIGNQLYRVQYAIFWLFWPPIHILSLIIIVYLIARRKYFAG